MDCRGEGLTPPDANVASTPGPVVAREARHQPARLPATGAPPGLGPGPGPVFSGVNRCVPAPDPEPETARQVAPGAMHRARADDHVSPCVTFIDVATARFDPVAGAVVVDGATRVGCVDAPLRGGEAAADGDAGGGFAGAGPTVPPRPPHGPSRRRPDRRTLGPGAAPPHAFARERRPPANAPGSTASAMPAATPSARVNPSRRRRA